MRKNLNTVAPALLGGFAFVNFILQSFIGLQLHFIYQKKKCEQLNGGKRKILSGYNNVDCFSYQELKEATNEFKEVGRGASRVVYKGIFEGKLTQLFGAVKKIRQNI